MASLDPYLKLAADKQAKQLILRPNQKPVLVIGDSQTAFGQAIHASQIKVAVAEVLTGPVKEQFMQNGVVKADYVFDDKTFRLVTRVSESGIEAIFVNIALTQQKNTGEFRAQMAKVDGANDPGNLNFYLVKMAQAKASDLHLCAGRRPRFRVDGDLVELDDLPALDPSGLEGMLFRIAQKDGEKEFKAEGSLDFAYSLSGVGRFRVNIYKESRGTSAALRMIPEEILSAEQLGLSAAIRKLAKLPKGLVLVTGPTGSGKSTTLAAIVDLVNRTRSDHILTVEAPIEFVHPDKKCLVHQREVGVHTGAFKAALRDALREDPDVVLVGEMRDLETISMAIETAATGHLVFGTLHTTTATSTVNRIIDIFPSDQQAQIRYSLAESLKAVIAQNLLKKIGGGRVAAQEVLIVTKSVSNLIRESKTHQLLNVMQTNKQLGMKLLNEELANLVADKVVDPGEAYSKAVDKDELLGMLRARGVDFQAPEDDVG